VASAAAIMPSTRVNLEHFIFIAGQPVEFNSWLPVTRSFSHAAANGSNVVIQLREEEDRCDDTRWRQQHAEGGVEPGSG
jgi:hypothetical protein